MRNRMLDGTSGPSDDSPAGEPCEVCGEQTGTGTVFYSDRRVLDGEDGRRSYVCSLCVQRMNRGRHGERLTDEEVRRAINTAGIAGQAWGGTVR